MSPLNGLCTPEQVAPFKWGFVFCARGLNPGRLAPLNGFLRPRAGGSVKWGLLENGLFSCNPGQGPR